jgi:uncharacterized protein
MSKFAPYSSSALGHSSQMTDLCQTLLASDLFTECLQEATRADLPDWWLCGGIIREIVWASLTTQEPTLVDIDLIYFDQEITARDHDRSLEVLLGTSALGVPWSIKNQARMWRRAGDIPYKSSLEALIAAPDSISSIGVKKDKADKLLVFAPYGLDDLFRMCLAPTEIYLRTRHVWEFRARIKNKGWLKRWPDARQDDEPRCLLSTHPVEWHEIGESAYARLRNS